jgi:hypothetical protein
MSHALIINDELPRSYHTLVRLHTKSNVLGTITTGKQTLGIREERVTYQIILFYSTCPVSYRTPTRALDLC